MEVNKAQGDVKAADQREKYLTEEHMARMIELDTYKAEAERVSRTCGSTETAEVILVNF